RAAPHPRGRDRLRLQPVLGAALPRGVRGEQVRRAGRGLRLHLHEPGLELPLLLADAILPRAARPYAARAMSAARRLLAAARWGAGVLARSRALGWALAGVGLAVLVGQIALWLPLHAQRIPMSNLDLMVYLRAAQRLAAGQPLYESCPVQNLHMP